MLRICFCILSCVLWLLSSVMAADEAKPKRDGNRLTYLDEPCHPYYVGKDFPKLTTPMWVGEEGVEAVVILGIDDMRDPAKYEAYLRPILNRLKQIDGRAPVSIMTCSVKPDDPQLQSWLGEGLSLEIHTVDHPCPLLQSGDLAKAKSTYDRCVDLMNSIPNNKPVCFRMPCCDSLNTVSPRFFTEIFNRTTEKNLFLQADSSVFNVFTSADESLPKELVLDADGAERFVSYIPSNVPERPDRHANFVNTIENYPYPYVIDRLCWEFPCVTPSDWSAQFRQKPNNPKTVEDWKVALDLTVIKQGVFCLVFHPHNWIKPEQVNELIDHAVTKHGKKVKFLTFREAVERLNQNVLGGRTLREGSLRNVADRIEHRRDQGPLPGVIVPFLKTPADPGLRFIDISEDGHDDLVFSNHERYGIWLWESIEKGWSIEILSGQRGSRPANEELPEIVRADGSNNGFWVHSRQLVWMNEDTAKNPQLIETRSFDSLLVAYRKQEMRKARTLPPVPIGAAGIDITPDYPIRLTGYASRTKESEGVAQKIFAKALAVGWVEARDPPESNKANQRGSQNSASNAGGSPASTHPTELSVLLTVDNCGVVQPIVEAVFDRLAKKHGLKREHFVVCSSHTHAGPWLPDFAPLVTNSGLPPEHLERMKKYQAELIEKLVKVADDAIAARRPGRLFTTSGAVGFAANRRVLQDGMWKGFGVQADGPVDHALPLLVAKDEAGKLMAVLANYACHCTTLGGDFNQISGDWAGYAMEYIEKEHPDAVSLISIGCGADANPEPRGKLEMCQQHGRAFADEVKKLLAGELAPVDPQIRARLLRVDLPFGAIPSKEEWEAKAKQAGVPGAHGQKFLDMLNRGEAIPTSFPYTISTWSFGSDLAMVFLAGEVVVDYSRRLSRELDAERLWVTAYANDVPCYIASKRVIQEGGYEVDFSMLYYGQPTRLAPEAEDVICDTVQKLLPQEFYSKAKQASFPPAKSPEESLASIKMRPGLKVELVAAEPLIRDPVAFDWDVRGRLWVVEMHDYPNGVMTPESRALQNDELRGGPGGRIRVLTDTDHDGRYDEAATFLDGIAFPSGLQLWRDGVIVTAAPEIFFAADRDGDGKAEVKQVLYRGFGEGNQQHRVNGLRYGLDNWLYAGNGDSGGEIAAVGRLLDKDDSPLASAQIRGRDLRIQPDNGLLDPVSGQTQFGRERNDQGDWFGNNNSRPLWHYALEDRYLRRNPHFAAPDARREIAEVPGAAPVFPISMTLARYNDFDRANRFTSACSTAIYRDRALGAEFTGNAFVCEPVHNLVSRLVLEADGATFKAHRAADEQQSEFLASSDNWFRPVMVRTGPDGALWIADMYRAVIEHPRWIPPEWQRRLDLRAGENRGRIYRVVRADDTCCGANTNVGWVEARDPPKTISEPNQTLRASTSNAAESTASNGTASGGSPASTHPTEMSTAELVAKLASANGWWRDTAQRLLAHRQDKAAIEPLVAMLQTHKEPLARLHALCTLDGLHALTTEHLLSGLRDKDAAVQRQAVRLCEGRLTEKALMHALGELPADQPKVVLQLASTLGDPDADLVIAGSCLARIAQRYRNDALITTAVLSSLNASNVETVEAAIAAALLTSEGDSPNEIISLLGRVSAQSVALRDGQLSEQALKTLLPRDEQQMASVKPTQLFPVLRQLLSGVRAEDLQKIAGSQPGWPALMRRVRHLATSNEAAANDRIAAIDLLGALRISEKTDVALLQERLSAREPLEVQQAAVTALLGLGRADVPGLLLVQWPSFGPQLRTHVLDGLLSRDASTQTLLEALSEGRVAGGDFDAARRQRLLTHRNSAIREKAAKLLESGPLTARQTIVDQYQPVLTMTGDATRGQAIFEKRCSACHALKGIGRVVGADLNAVKDRSTPALLTAILDPNRAVEARYLAYTAVLTDGRSISGLLASESGNSIVIAGTDGKPNALARSEIDELLASNKSFMPEGLEKDIPQAEMADLIAFVQSAGTPSKTFEGHHPEVVTASADGSLKLLASNAEIRGATLVFEKPFQNLGWWQSPDDEAGWTVQMPRAGRYSVMLTWACAGSAGGRYVINIADQKLTGTVLSTQTWENYQTAKIGEVTLPAGSLRLTMRPVEGGLKGPLLDLKELRLVP